MNYYVSISILETVMVYFLCTPWNLEIITDFNVNKYIF